MAADRQQFANYAQPGIAPAAFTPPGPTPGAFAPQPGGMPVGATAYYGPGAPGFCQACGGSGCNNCRGTIDDDFDLRIFQRLLPYNAGGVCAPRWLDFHVEGLHLSREDVSRRVDFTSQGPTNGNIVLSTDDLDFDEEGGVRFSAWMQLGPGGGLDFSYLGLFNWRDIQTVTDPTGNLYSPFSNFGQPPFGINGIDETDRAVFHQIAYSSAMDGVELSFRRHWQAPNCRIQGSWLIGVRHVSLKETLTHTTISNFPAPNQRMDYAVNTSNSLTGIQIGTDAWVTVIPGLRIGGELKGGFYGSLASSDTTITATSLGSPVREQLSDDTVAAVAEAGLMMTWQINAHVAFRGGYQFFYIDGVALAAENFNSGAAFVANERFPFLNHNGDVFLHGATGGLELRW